MTNLRDAMLDAGAPRDDWNAEIPALIAAGQKRVRRRKIIAAGATAAVVAVVGTTAVLAGLPGLNRADPDPVKPDKRGVYVEERLAPAEVERRCNIVLNAYNHAHGNPEFRWVANSTEDRVGRTIEMRSTGVTTTGDEADAIEAGGFGDCVIPQKAMLDHVAVVPPTDVPSWDKPSAIIEQCSTQAGFDFTGWTILASASFDRSGARGVSAILMSVNGYAVQCDVGTDEWVRVITFLDRRFHDDHGRPIVESSDTGPRDPKRYRGVAPRCFLEDPLIGCTSTGVIPGLPDGYRIEVFQPDGSVDEFVTNRGAFAVVVRFGKANGSPDRLDARVLDPNGEVVWESRIQP